MAAGFLSRFRTFAEPPSAADAEPPAGPEGRGALALLSRLTAPVPDLARADTSWRPDTRRLRIEIMANGPFERLRGIRAAATRLQENLVGRILIGAVEVRLTEVRRTCRHVTAWSRSPVDPGAGTTEWECLEDALGDEPEDRTLFAQAFRDSVRNGVNHVVLFGGSLDDGLFSLNTAVHAFRRHGVRVSTFYLGDDFTGRSRYRFLAAATGGLHLALPGERSLDDAVLPIVAAFACGDHARLAALPAPTPKARALMKQVWGK
jgi:hypothetical protein